MSEQIYRGLLRLFPSRFRAAYGDEALQLFRDRSRDEKDFFHALRLWFDLLFDLAISVPGEYLRARPALRASAQQHFSGAPSFFVLEHRSPRPGALLFGSMLSLITICAFPTLISQVDNNAAGSKTAWGQPSGRSRFSQRQLPRSNQHAAAPATNAAPSVDTNLDAAERRRILDSAIANLKQHYPYPDAAQKIADSLLARAKRGEYETVTDRRAFADLLTEQMRNVSHDMHLEVVYSQSLLPQQPAAPTAEDLARYRQTMQRQNCTFEKVEVLPHNIGYLKLNFFPDPSVCESTARAAMDRVNHANALIFDLRDNRGGEPAMVKLIADYLFDHPEYFYNPRENTTEQSWTQSPVADNMLADKPVYVLTSASTFSGAEQFCYDLKMLKRATLVGEATGGGAHAGVFHRLDDHFGMGIPEAMPINPYSSADWEGTGVQPDVKVNAADALKAALKLAESKLQK
jgi:peptidase S41-like protein